MLKYCSLRSTKDAHGEKLVKPYGSNQAAVAHWCQWLSYEWNQLPPPQCVYIYTYKDVLLKGLCIPNQPSGVGDSLLYCTTTGQSMSQVVQLCDWLMYFSVKHEREGGRKKHTTGRKWRKGGSAGWWVEGWFTLSLFLPWSQCSLCVYKEVIKPQIYHFHVKRNQKAGWGGELARSSSNKLLHLRLLKKGSTPS